MTFFSKSSTYNDGKLIDSYGSSIVAFNTADLPNTGNYAASNVISPFRDPQANRLTFFGCGKSGLIYNVSLYDGAAVYNARTYKLRLYNTQALDNNNGGNFVNVRMTSGLIAEIDLSTPTRTGDGGLIVSQMNNPVGYYTESENIYGVLVWESGVLAFNPANYFEIKLDFISKQ